MNYRIDPSELNPKPGARERILRAGEAYQARQAGHPFRRITIRCETAEAYEAAAQASKEAAQASDRLSAFIAMAIATFGRPVPLNGEETNRILEEVAAKHDVTVADIRGPRRRIEISHARQEAMYRLYSERKNLSLPMIGRMLSRDHTTVMHGIRAHAKRADLPGATRVQRAHTKPKRQWRSKAK